MADVYTSELITQELDVMHFGFSPLGFTDKVYNLALDCWAHVVENFLMEEPMLKAATDKKALKRGAIDMIFFPSFMDTFKSFKDYALRYVFRIPSSVTLPVYKSIHKLTAEMAENGGFYDVGQEERRIKKVEKNVNKKKLVIAELDKQLAEADKCIEELETIIRLHKEMNK